MISREEILMGREKNSPLDAKLKKNLEKLLKSVNMVRTAYGKAMRVTSGYRPASINVNAGGAKKSAHMSCEAVDFEDSDRELALWCLLNIEVLEAAGLYMENPLYTKNWLHLQTRRTSDRVFIP